MFQRSMSTGYAGVQNPLVPRGHTRMLFGDARERVDDILKTSTVRPLGDHAGAAGSPTRASAPAGAEENAGLTALPSSPEDRP